MYDRRYVVFFFTQHLRFILPCTVPQENVRMPSLRVPILDCAACRLRSVDGHCSGRHKRAPYPQQGAVYGPICDTHC